MPASLGMVGDDRDALVHQISRGLRADVLLLSGGVSAGVLDLVPEALVALNVLAAMAIGAIGGGLARTSGRHAAWGVLLTPCTVCRSAEARRRVPLPGGVSGRRGARRGR